MKMERNWNLRHLLWGGSVLLLILLSYEWRLRSNLWHLKISQDFYNYDEGIHLILGKLWAAGYIPYEQIFVSYPPVFIWSLGLPWKLFSQPSALQLLMATYALMGVVAVVYLGAVYRSPLSGLVAGLFLSFTPDYFIPSIAVMGEVQSVGVTVLAIALAEQYRRNGGWGWLLLAGSVLAFGLSIKILPVYAVPLAGLMTISRHLSLAGGWAAFWSDLQSSRRLLIRDVAILAVSFLIVFFLPFLFFKPQAFYDQVVGMRLISRATEFNPFESNTKDIVDFLFGNVTLMLLVLYGLVFVILPQFRAYWLLLAWFILVWVSMRFHVPLRSKHLPVFLPILVLIAGLAVDHLLNFFRNFNLSRLSPRNLTLVFSAGIILGMFLWEIPQMVAENSGTNVVAEEPQEETQAINFIQTISTPHDCAIADNPVFLYKTGLLPPPELSEVSSTRIETGYLTLADVTGALEKYDCHVVVILTGRFGEAVPGLVTWLDKNYLGLYNQNNEVLVYFAKKGGDSAYTPVAAGEFEGQFKLYGVSFKEGNLGKPGRFVSLFWQLQAPLKANYSQKLTLRPTHQAQAVYQTSRLPFAGQWAPENWEVGGQVRDTFYLDLPGDLRAGTYDLYLSVCVAETGQCLPVNGTPDQTELYLGQIVVRAS